MCEVDGVTNVHFETSGTCGYIFDNWACWGVCSSR